MRILLSALMIFSGLTAQAMVIGGETSGDGGAFVCGLRGSDGKPDHVDFLDVWEANKLLGWPIKATGEDVKTIVARAMTKLQKMSPDLAPLVQAAMTDVMSKLHNLPDGIVLGPPSDANATYHEPNCDLQGVLYYDADLGVVQVDAELFGYMNSVDQAAGYLHEAIYKFARDYYGDKDSKRARRAVGCLLSDACGGNWNFVIPQTGNLSHCKSMETNFEYYYYPAGRQQTNFIITQMGGSGATGFWQADVDYFTGNPQYGPYTKDMMIWTDETHLSKFQIDSFGAPTPDMGGVFTIGVKNLLTGQVISGTMPGPCEVVR